MLRRALLQTTKDSLTRRLVRVYLVDGAATLDWLALFKKRFHVRAVVLSTRACARAQRPYFTDHLVDAEMDS